MRHGKGIKVVAWVTSVGAMVPGWALLASLYEAYPRLALWLWLAPALLLVAALTVALALGWRRPDRPSARRFVFGYFAFVMWPMFALGVWSNWVERKILGAAK